MASEKGYIQIARELLLGGAEVDAINNNEYTPLHIASEKGYIEMIKELLLGGAEVNAKNQFG